MHLRLSLTLSALHFVKVLTVGRAEENLADFVKMKSSFIDRLHGESKINFRDSARIHNAFFWLVGNEKPFFFFCSYEVMEKNYLKLLETGTTFQNHQNT